MTTHQRADARRNREAILRSALTLFESDPHATMATIAAAAGVGRVTLYGHFACRELLVDAAFVEAMARSSEVLDALDLTGEPQAVLDRLVDGSWRALVQNRSMLQAAVAALPAERVRGSHDVVLDRVREVVLRGQGGGAFRRDLSAVWLVAWFYATLHAAAEEVAAGRLDDLDAPRVVRVSVRSMLAAPQAGSPAAETLD